MLSCVHLSACERASEWLRRAWTYGSVYCCRMDPLAAVLAGPTARGAFVLRCSLEPPWSMRIEDRAPLTVVALVRGEAYVVPSDGAPVLRRAGGVAGVGGTSHYTFADDPTTAPQVR